MGKRAAEMTEAQIEYRREVYRKWWESRPDEYKERRRQRARDRRKNLTSEQRERLREQQRAWEKQQDPERTRQRLKRYATCNLLPEQLEQRRKRMNEHMRAKRAQLSPEERAQHLERRRDKDRAARRARCELSAGELEALRARDRRYYHQQTAEQRRKYQATQRRYRDKKKLQEKGSADVA